MNNQLGAGIILLCIYCYFRTPVMTLAGVYYCEPYDVIEKILLEQTL